jgi:hypothetical protein
MKRWPRVPAILLFAMAVMSVASTACIYDSNDRCGTAMTYLDAVGACVCDQNAIAVIGGCQACPDGQVPDATKSQCQAPAAAAPAAAATCETEPCQ